MASRILRNRRDLQQWVNFLTGQAFPMTASYVSGAKRTNPQNATAAMWYAQIGAETGETPAQVKARCKLTHGRLIMQKDRPDWVTEWEPLYAPIPHHMRLKLFEALPLTRLLTTRQMSEYLDAVKREHEEMGIELVDPEARKYEREFGNGP